MSDPFRERRLRVVRLELAFLGQMIGRGTAYAEPTEEISDLMVIGAWPDPEADGANILMLLVASGRFDPVPAGERIPAWKPTFLRGIRESR